MKRAVPKLNKSACNCQMDPTITGFLKLNFDAGATGNPGPVVVGKGLIQESTTSTLCRL